MQIQILKPSSDGNHYPDYDEMIRNAREPEEKNYLMQLKRKRAEWALRGDHNIGFPFGIVYIHKMSCGHYELFQHPIYRDYGKEPTENDILDSLEDVIRSIKDAKKEHMKCTRCICNWNL